MFYSDGGKVFQRTAAVNGEFMATALSILNLPLLVRHCDAALFSPFMFVKAPETFHSKASNTMTFLTPLLDDMAEMQWVISWAFKGQANVRSKPQHKWISFCWSQVPVHFRYAKICTNFWQCLRKISTIIKVGSDLLFKIENLGWNTIPSSQAGIEHLT